MEVAVLDAHPYGWDLPLDYYNGGITLFHKLLPFGNARVAIDPENCNPGILIPEIDQNGNSWPGDDNSCDIGAVEHYQRKACQERNRGRAIAPFSFLIFLPFINNFDHSLLFAYCIP